MTISNNPQKRALLIHQGAIGDFLIACRLIEFIDKLHGGYQWSYLGKPSHGRLAQALRLIDSHENFDRPGWHLLFTSNETIPDAIAAFLRSFDLILNVICGPQTLFANRLEQVCTGQVIHVDPKLPEDYPNHVFQFLTGQIHPGLVDLPQSAFPVSPDILETVKKSNESDLVLFHPGASSSAKRWPIENFIRLIQTEKSNGRRVGILLGQVELEQFEPQKLKLIESLAEPLFDKPLENVAGILALSQRYIGNDNGISHLAAAVGADTTAVFIRKNAHQWHPLGPNIRIQSIYTQSASCVRGG